MPTSLAGMTLPTIRQTVSDLVLETLRSFARGEVTASHANTVKDLAKVWALLQCQDESGFTSLPAITVRDPDEIDLARLVTLMEQREWTARDLRRLAYKNDLFKGWLSEGDSAAIHSRFGWLCANAAGREFPEGVFMVRGTDQTRRYLIRPGSAAEAQDWSI